jgi:DNA-binding transcriptional MocR family regulator
MRNEVLRVGTAELARVVAVGVWIATYADADGSSAFPGRDTLARLAGCSKETVTRAVNVLVAAGVLQRKRRPNQSSLFQLLIPTERPDWAAHMHLYTETRQKAYRRRQQAEEAAERAGKAARKASQDAIRKASQDAHRETRKASPSNLPESVAGRSPDDPEGVPGRPRKASQDASRKASPAGAYQYTPTYGRDPGRDQEMAELEPQPQVVAPEPGENDHSAQQDPDGPALRRCTDCDQPLVRPGRTRCTGCERTHHAGAA